MRTILLFLITLVSASAQPNFAVTLATNDVDGRPNGWPIGQRQLGATTGPLNGAEILMTQPEVDAAKVPLQASYNAWLANKDLNTKVALSRLLVLSEAESRTMTILFKGFMQTIFPTLNLSRTNHGTNALTQNQWLQAFQLNVSNLLMSDISTNNP